MSLNNVESVNGHYLIPDKTSSADLKEWIVGKLSSGEVEGNANNLARDPSTGRVAVDLRGATVSAPCSHCGSPLSLSGDILFDDAMTLNVVDHVLREPGGGGYFEVDIVVLCPPCLEKAIMFPSNVIPTSAEEEIVELKRVASAGICPVCGLRVLNGTGSSDEYESCIMCNERGEAYKPTECFSCKFVMNESELIKTTDGKTGKELLVCRDCYAARCCHNCGVYKPPYSVECFVKGQNDKKQHIVGCSNCLSHTITGEVRKCVLCGKSYDETLQSTKEVPPSLAYPDAPGKLCVCNDCSRYIGSKCKECGSTKNTKHNLCDACRSGHVHEWNHRPGYVFHTTRKDAVDVSTDPMPGKDQVYYGIELEITGFDPARMEDRVRNGVSGNKLKCAIEMHGISGINESEFYFMSDSSIGNGYEIGFHPRNLDSWLSDGRAMLDRVCSIARKHGAVSYRDGNCGIHIHRSLYDMGNLHTANLFGALAGLEPFAYIIAQRTGVTNKVSGRGGIELAKYGNFDSIKRHFPEGVHIKGLAKSLVCKSGLWRNAIAEDHSSALSLSSKGTAELRIFRGTLNVPTIMAYISFYHLLAEWSKSRFFSLSASAKNNAATNWSNFSKFVRHCLNSGKHVDAAEILIEYTKSKGVSL